jgi:hypothetical protein
MGMGNYQSGEATIYSVIISAIGKQHRATCLATCLLRACVRLAGRRLLLAHAATRPRQRRDAGLLTLTTGPVIAPPASAATSCARLRPDSSGVDPWRFGRRAASGGRENGRRRGATENGAAVSG